MAQLPSGTVTFLFTDIEGSTRLWQEHTEAMSDALARHDAIVRDAIEGRGGYVVKTTGDGAHAVFLTASDAIDAAIAAQVALDTEEWPLPERVRVRIGIHSGPAELRDGDYYGTAVNRAARIMAAAHGGQVVMSLAAEELVRDTAVEVIDLGEHRLKDLGQVERIFQVAHPELERDFPPLRSLDASRTNLPNELSEFVGRENDVAGLVALLAESRMLTLIGVGGVGKTRLALRVGSELLSDYRDGVWFCPLASVRDDDEVLEAIAAAIGYVPPAGTKVIDGLSRFLEHKMLLLILDNCEHVVRTAAEVVGALLSAAPRLAVLATSREALRVSGERVYPVGSLSLPSFPDPEAVLASESGTLFALRAREANGSFEIGGSNASAVRDICVRLDGIPLALELAAARCIALSPSEILVRLDQQFRLLAGGNRTALERHQTLRAAIDWSYDLLDERERNVLDRCAVFVGGFDLAAIAAVAVSLEIDEIEVAGCIGSLVAKSLVERGEDDRGSRYRLLEMIRQYLAERLEDGGAATEARDLHARHYLAFAKHRFAAANSTAAWDAINDLDREVANLAAAGRWLLDRGRSAELLEFFADVPFVDSTALPAAVLDALGRTAADCIAVNESPTHRGAREACFVAAMRHFFDGDTTAYRRYSELGNTIPGPPSARMALLASSVAMIIEGDVEKATQIAKDAIEIARVNGSREELAFTLGFIAVFEQLIHPDDALRHALEGVALARRCGSPIALLYPLLGLTMALVETDPAQALAAADECIQIDRSQRRTWSSPCRAQHARMQMATGDTAGAYREMRDLLIDVARDGDRVMLSSLVLLMAEMMMNTDPGVTLQLAAIYESDAIAAWGDFSYFPAIAALANERPTDLEAARQAAASMTYDNAIAFILAAVDAAIANNEARCEQT